MSRIEQAAGILRSGDIEQRRRAIKWLAKTGDPAAAESLVWASQNDPDPELQDLARKGVLYIEKQQEQAAEVTPEEAERAERLFEKAAESYLSNDNKSALNYLARAIDLDPAIRRNGEAQAIAEGLTGLSGEIALTAVADPSGHENYAAPRKEKTINEDVPTWGDVWMDMAIFFVVNLAGFVVALLVGTARAVPLLQDVQLMPEYQEFAIESGDLIADFLSFLDAGLLVIILIAVIGTGLQTITRFINNHLYHLTAVHLLKGEGLPTQSHKTLIPFQTGFNGLTHLLTIIVLLLMPTSVLALEQSALWQSSGDLLSLVSGGGSFALSIYLASRLGKVHDFGLGKGFLSMLIPGLVFGFIAGCLFVTIFVAVIGSI